MDIQQFILLAARRAACGEGELPQDTPNLFEVHAAARNFGMENIVAYALADRKDRIDPAAWARLETGIFRAIAQEAEQEKALSAFLGALKKREIPYILLKGYVLKHLYPSSDMRYMGDIDILIPPTHAAAAKEILGDLGFCINFENVRELNAVNEKQVHLEIHLDMVSAQFKTWHAYYGDIWEKAKKTAEGESVLSDEDFFIYHIVHLAKHYKGTGIGPRAFLDVFVFLSQKPNLDFVYIKKELEKLGLSAFAKNVIALSRMWFGEGERTDLLSSMEQYVLESGLYGSREHAAVHEKVLSLRDGKGKTGFRAVFPTMHTMSILYPALRKRKYLLWYYYIKRILDRLIHGRKTAPVPKTAEMEKVAVRIADHIKTVGL